MSTTDTDGVRIITNNVPRDIIDAWELNVDDRARFDYLDWDAIDAGTDSASFFRYKGDLHDLGEFTSFYGISRDGVQVSDVYKGWDGFRADSFFSGLLVRYVDDNERIVVALTLS